MKTAIISMSSLIVLTAIGSVNQLPQIPYIVIGAVVLVTLLIAFNKINSKYYSIYIFGLALSLLYQTSMLGTQIVGVDIHTEYFVANRIIENGWDANWANNNNSSIVLAWITPFFNWIGVNVTWTFKAIHPIACAGAPVVLYYAIRRVLGEKKAYFSCLFLITMPMFTMEVVSIVKSMWAYLFVACTVFFITSSYKNWIKALGISLSVIMTIITHYSVGTILLYYTIVLFGVLLVTNWGKVKEIAGKYRMPLRYTAMTTAAILLAYFLWFSNTGQGSMLRVVFAIANNISDVSQEVIVSDSATIQNPDSNLDEYLSYTTPSSNKTGTYLDLQSPLVRTAIGLDFSTASAWGKGFRIIQYLTQALMIAGLWFVLKKYRQVFPTEYTASIIASFILLIGCIFVPFLTTTLSATRYYIVTLFFIAPLVIIGIEELSKWIRKPQLQH